MQRQPVADMSRGAKAEISLQVSGSIRPGTISKTSLANDVPFPAADDGPLSHMIRFRGFADFILWDNALARRGCRISSHRSFGPAASSTRRYAAAVESAAIQRMMVSSSSGRKGASPA